MTRIINLYGGPGTGKSTSAAYLYYLLKDGGHNTELVREYAKNWAWEGRRISEFDQFYFMGKQIRLESQLYGKVDYVVTDSPVWLAAYYAHKYGANTTFQAINQAVHGFYKVAESYGHKHYHCFLTRSKPYNPAGRYQSEEQSLEIDAELLAMLNTWKLPYCVTKTTREGVSTLFDMVIQP